VPTINRIKFLAECENVTPFFTPGIFSALLEKIDKYNAAVRKAAAPPTTTNGRGFADKFQDINPQYPHPGDDEHASSLFGRMRYEPGIEDKLLQQASHSKAAQAEIELKAALLSLNPQLKMKYAGPLAYVQSCMKGKIAKPDESQVFKTSVKLAGRGAPLDLRAEGFPSLAALEEVANNLKIISLLVLQAAGWGERGGPRSDWFAQQSRAEVQSALENLGAYLSHRCERLTFKVLKTGMRCDNGEMGENVAGQVIPTVMLEGQDDPDLRKENGYLHVPTGLRIFLGPSYLAPVAGYYDAVRKTLTISRFMTLFHEMTHKIIGTTDEGRTYGYHSCKAIKDTDGAVKCADSWTYFLSAYAQALHRLS
jgi:hypothetical protein